MAKTDKVSIRVEGPTLERAEEVARDIRKARGDRTSRAAVLERAIVLGLPQVAAEAAGAGSAS